MSNRTIKILLGSLFLLAVTNIQAQYAETSNEPSPTEAQAAPERPKVNMGNGLKNWIVVDGVTRENKVLTFPEVHVDGNSWLVMHPFEDGKPNGDKYVAASYVQKGTTTNVPIKVHKGVETDEMFIVMLHRDLNENRILDFVFTSDTGVMDAAVFEGTTMIAHAISAP